MPKVFIIVLNWNGYRDTVECLRSIERSTYPAYEVVVVDNGSTDGSVARLKEKLKDIIYIENKENLGFAGGNNMGIRHALDHDADYVLLLNNDTVVNPDLLDWLVKTGESDKRIGILGPKIYYGDVGSNFIWFAGGEIDRRKGKTKHKGLYEIDQGQWDNVEEVDYVSGCAMLIKRKVFEDVGQLDERFYLYYEETDFCMRVRENGYKVLYIPNTKIWHKASSSTGGIYGPIYTYYMTRNRLLFMRMYHNEVNWRRFIFYFYLDGLLRRSLVLSYKSKWRIKSLKALWLGWKDFKDGRFYKGPEWLHQAL